MIIKGVLKLISVDRSFVTLCCDYNLCKCWQQEGGKWLLYYSLLMFEHLVGFFVWDLCWGLVSTRVLSAKVSSFFSFRNLREQDVKGQHQSAAKSSLPISILKRSSRNIGGEWMRELSQRSGCRVVDVGGEWFIHEATNAFWMRDVALCITAIKIWDFGGTLSEQAVIQMEKSIVFIKLWVLQSLDAFSVHFHCFQQLLS